MTNELKIKISADLNDLKKGLTEAESVVGKFASTADKSAATVSGALDDVSEAAKETERTFTLLKNAPFSFGVNGKKASQEVSQGLSQVDTSVQKTERSFTLLSKAPFTFGVNAKKALTDVKNAANTTTPAVGRLSREIRGTNTVGIEFSRIIQDAPFGIIGVGNNITQLTQSFANLRAQTGSTSQALRIAFSSLLSGTNLLVLGISAVTTAFTLYTMWSRRAKSETEEVADAQQEYTDALNAFVDAQDAVSRSRVKGLQDSSREIATLRALYGVATDTTLATEKRKQAVDSLQKEYPKYFGNLNDELILTGQAAAAYRRLTSDILASGKARAAIRLQADAYDELAAIDLRREKRTERINDLLARQRRLADDIRAAGGAGAVPDITDEQARNVQKLGSFLTKTTSEVGKLQMEFVKNQAALADLTDERTEDGLREIGLYQDIDKLQKSIVSNVQAGGKIIDDTTKKTAQNTKQIADYASQISNIFSGSDRPTEQLGLTGLDLDTEKIRQRYEKMYSDLNKVEQKIRADNKLTHEQRLSFLEETAKVRAQLGINEAHELSNALITEEQRTADTIAAIYAKAGVSRINSLNQDLQRIKAYYDEQRRIHKDNIEVINALNEAQRQEETNARRKWQADLISIEVDTSRRVNELRSQLMLRQLNNEVKIWKKAALERLKAMVDAGESETKIREAQAKEQADIQERYWKRIMEIQRFKEMERMAESFTDALSNAFEDSLVNGTNFFKALGDEFKRMLIRMAADAVRAQIGKAIMSGISSSGGGGGGGFWGFLGSALGWAGKLFGGSGYSSGSFPSGNYGGGNFPASNPIKGGGFVPGVQSSIGSSNDINLSSKLYGNDILMANTRSNRFYNRFNGGQ